MSVVLSVDLDDPTPPYEQLRRQIALAIETGQLEPDERLAPLRQLAGDLGLAVGTVARAYRELEAAGLVRSRRGGGTRVTTGNRSEVAVGRRLEEAARTYLLTARALGASSEQARLALEHAARADEGS